jgi:hypothetical protein
VFLQVPPEHSELDVFLQPSFQRIVHRQEFDPAQPHLFHAHSFLRQQKDLARPCNRLPGQRAFSSINPMPGNLPGPRL